MYIRRYLDIIFSSVYLPTLQEMYSSSCLDSAPRRSCIGQPKMLCIPGVAFEARENLRTVTKQDIRIEKEKVSTEIRYG